VVLRYGLWRVHGLSESDARYPCSDSFVRLVFDKSWDKRGGTHTRLHCRADTNRCRAPQAAGSINRRSQQLISHPTVINKIHTYPEKLSEVARAGTRCRQLLVWTHDACLQCARQV
jgi:hypothetical protein